MNCGVLRCIGQAETIFVVPDVPGRRIELGVCTAHAEAIEAGLAWRYTPDRRLLVGDDVVGDGERRITEHKWGRDFEQVTNVIEGRSSFLKITHTDLVGGDEQQVTFMLGDDELASLRDLITPPEKRQR